MPHLLIMMTVSPVNVISVGKVMETLALTSMNVPMSSSEILSIIVTSMLDVSILMDHSNVVVIQAGQETARLVLTSMSAPD